MKDNVWLWLLLVYLIMCFIILFINLQFIMKSI